jgi:tRNA (guanine-N7-)-methyltransferase
MKASDLKHPLPWEERRPVLQGRVLFVPKYFEKHHEWQFAGFDDPTWFGNQNKVCVEYCSGNGTWIIDKALANPDVNWIAVEKKFERVRKIWVKAEKRALPNLIVICGAAETFTRFYLPKSSVDEVYINFPDPWPKLKHAKHRLIQAPFVQELARIVKNEGKVTLVTDDPPYCKQMIKTFQTPSWSSFFEEPYYAHEWSAYGTSYFDQLWRGKGRAIHYMHFVRGV